MVGFKSLDDVCTEDNYFGGEGLETGRWKLLNAKNPGCTTSKKLCRKCKIIGSLKLACLEKLNKCFYVCLSVS